jgi:hypothetical protein
MARRPHPLKGREAFYMMRRVLSNLALAPAVFGGPLSGPSRRRDARTDRTNRL